MKRKDMIIVAVLINSVLLIGLFISSVTHDKKPTGKSDLVRVTKQAPHTPVATVADAPGAGLACQKMKLETTTKVQKKGASQRDNIIAQIKEKKPVVNQKKKVTEISFDPRVLNKKIQVKKGDALGKIAREHGLTVAQIMQANHLKNAAIKVGQTLTIPAQTLSKKALSNHHIAYHTVMPGDNPTTIALKYRMKVGDLLRLNALDTSRAKKLRPGDKLRVR